MPWENIKLTGIISAIFGALAYAYSRIPLLLFIFAVLLIATGFINTIEKR
ncbi:MAG TPA: hypothetical protein HA362_04440 [Nanoarchaeota archaeon]|nr:hypothetical protein [Nanoarchaeota archaeon]